MSNAALYVVTVLVWGSTWLAIEFQLGIVAPEVSIVYRYAGASLLLFAWSRIRGLRLAFGLLQHARFLLLGMLLFGLNYIFAYRAQIHISSALTAIAFSTILWMNIVNARLFFGVRAGRRVLFGALLGVAGIFTLFAPQIARLFPDTGWLTLEDALASCMKLYQPVPVRDAGGALLGTVYPQDLAKALQAESA